MGCQDDRPGPCARCDAGVRRGARIRVRLIACQSCHTQYDVTLIIEKEITCRCGEKIENRDPRGRRRPDPSLRSCGAQVGRESPSCDYCGSSIVRDKAQLSLICPECYGRNAQDARFCAGCGVTFDPEPVEAQGIELPCPCCGRLMPATQVGGIGLNECTECSGVWAPGEKFDQLVDRAIEARRQAGEQTTTGLAPRVKGSNPFQQRVQYRKCPECEAFMQRRNFRKASGVIIDRCNQHGTWLDADELEQIAGFILSGGRPEAERYHEEGREAIRFRTSAGPSSRERLGTRIRIDRSPAATLTAATCSRPYSGSSPDPSSHSSQQGRRRSMALMDKLRAELIDIVEWIDDSQHTIVWRFPALPQPDQERRPADRAPRADGRPGEPRQARGCLRTRPLQPRDQEHPDP